MALPAGFESVPERRAEVSVVRRMTMIRRITMCVLLSLALTGSAFAGFVNGGFESGDFTGWTQGAGYWYGGMNNLDPVNYLPGGQFYDMSANASSVVGPGLDPNTDNNLNMVYADTYAARVNDSYNNYSVSVISQTVSNYTDPNIYFAWAAVLEASHGPTDSDNFTLQLIDDTTHTPLVNLSYESYDNGAIFHTFGNWYYTDWQIE